MSMDKFIKECLYLNDLSPEMACRLIYGEWKVASHENPHPVRFSSQDYLRYSPEARKEVIEALWNAKKTKILTDTCIGWVEQPAFLQEFDLWKQWGVSSSFINGIIDEYLDLKVYHYFWFNSQALDNLMNYIDKKLAPHEAADWIEAIARKCDPSSAGYQHFTDIINKYTVRA